MLEVRGLTRRYGELRAIDGIDLTVGSGEAVALLGANGSGKTTALRCIAGELVPTAGSVRVAGVDPHAEPGAESARRALAFVADTPVFYRELTVQEHLELVAAAFDDADGVDRGMAVLAELGLEGRRRARAHELSSGQRQKVLLACVHARPLAVLLLDEPVLRLDPGAQEWLHDRLAAHLDAGVAVVVATHQPRFPSGLARRAVCLEEGEVVADEPLEAFLDRGADRLIGRLGIADDNGEVEEPQ